jgi:putative membrane protein
MFEVHPFLHHNFGWHPVIALFFGALFVALLVILIVWAVRHSRQPSGTPSGHDALDIAKKRYASGEISHEEFERIKKNLS